VTDYAQQRMELRARLQKSLKDSEGMSGMKMGWIMADLHATIGLLADVGNQEIAEAHTELTRRTQELTAATGRLNLATWILFFATLALFLVTMHEVMKTH
jgi:hypothetical protein